MAEVAVHLADELVAAHECFGEACEIRIAKALLAGAMEHGHAWIDGGAAIRDLTRAVRRTVVDDEHIHRRIGEDRVEHRQDVVLLVVGRQHDERAARRCMRAGRNRALP